MFPSEMDDGQSMLDVNIDTNLFSDILNEESNGVSNISDVDCGTSAFDWADDFISSASTPYLLENTPDESPASAAAVPSPSPSTSATENQVVVSTAAPTLAQVVVAAQPGGVLQQTQQVGLQSSQILQKSAAGILQGLTPGTQHFVVKTAGGQIQFHQQPQVQSASGPVATQQFSVPSPAISRSITPSQSPAPSISPHISRSITPNQPTIQQNVIANTSLSSSPSPNILQLASSQSQVQQLTNALPIQSIIQNTSQNASIIPNQAVLQGQASNIVHTQNAVIQNPNVVNLNVATHVLCGTSGQQQTGQVQNNIQGLPVTVQNPGTIQGNLQGLQGNLQGTLIQTAQGKSILLPNLNTVQQHVIQGQQLMSGTGTVIQNAAGVGNVIRLAAQPAPQEKTGSVVPPNISLVNLGGGQGQQILIQRAPQPAQGQQNIILRAVPQNLIQIPGNQAGQTGLHGTPLQTASQISQQILTQATNQSVQYQQVLAGSQPQQVKIVSQPGQQLTSQAGALTLNLGGQNVNLVSGQMNIQQLSGLGTNAVGSVQGIQLQQGANQYIVQPAQTQFTAQPQSVNVSSSSQNIVSKALISSGLSQVINTPLEPKSSNNGSETPASSTKKSSKKSKGEGAKTQKIPTSQLIAAASNAAGINTSQSTATTMTTTVSQSSVQIPAQLSVANSVLGPQVVSSVQPRTSVGVVQSSQIKIQPQGNLGKPGPPNVTICRQAPPAQNTQAEQLRLQKVQMEIDKMLSQNQNLSADQIQKLTQLQQNLKKTYPTQPSTTPPSTGSVSPKPIKPLAQVTAATQPMVGQPLVAQPQIVVSQAPQMKSEPGTRPTSTQASIVLQPQPAGSGGVIQLTVSQPTSSPGVATQLVKTVAQTVQPQYLPKVIKQSPTKTITVAPSGTQPQVIQIQTTPAVTAVPTASTIPATKVIHAAPPGKLPISATPSIQTQIKIGSQVLTLYLTNQQKEKLQQHLGRMTLEQQEAFLKQQQHVFAKLQQQQQLQVIQHTSSAANGPAQLLVANQPGTIPITVQQIDKGINQISVGAQNRAVKRPAATEQPKGTLNIHQQLSKDQQHAVSPDTKSPFKDRKEACRRLLRYHVFQHHGPKEEAFRNEETTYNTVAEDLLSRSGAMMNKYRYLLLQDSMRHKPSAEMVMIHRMLNQDLASVLKKEKEIVKTDPDSFVPMPVKYLKIEKKEDYEESAADTSAHESSAVKSENLTESEISDHDTSESVLHSSADSEQLSLKSSPIVPAGKVKLVIRNDGRGFTSSLKAKTPIKTEPPSPRITPEKVVIKEESKQVEGFNGDQFVSETIDVSDKCDAENVLGGDVCSSDVGEVSLQTGFENTSFQAQLSDGMSEPLNVGPFQTFSYSNGELKVKGSGVPNTAESEVSQLVVHQTHYSDISIADISGDYPNVVSPTHRALDPGGGSHLGEFSSEITHEFDPSSFDFPEEISRSLCHQNATSPELPRNSSGTYSSITTENGFAPGIHGTSPIHITSSPNPVLDSEEPLAFVSSQSRVPTGCSEVNSAVCDIMDFDDVSRDGNIASITSAKGLHCNSAVLQNLPQTEMMFSPQPADNSMSDGAELDASFESDGNDPQNQMMNAQMQSAIDSILSLNQSEDQSDLNQSAVYFNNQLSEVTDTSQDSEYYMEAEEEIDKPPASCSGSGEGETSMEDDLDAAVQSIL